MSSYELQIVTLDGSSFDGRAEKLIVRAVDGDVCILARHVNYVTALGTGVARITIDGKERLAACSGGMLSVIDGHVRLVASTFEWENEIDAARAEAARARAEQRLQDANNEAEITLAKAKLSRALTRLNVAK